MRPGGWLLLLCSASPLAIVAIAHAAGWTTYLRKSRRVRSLFV